MKTTQFHEPSDALTEDRAFSHILHLDAKDVNLKFIFDNIRNYGICGAMLWAAPKVLLAASTTAGFIERSFSLVAYAVLISLPWLLFALNFGQLVLGFFKLQNPSKLNTFLYLLITLSILIAAIKFMLVAKGA